MRQVDDWLCLGGRGLSAVALGASGSELKVKKVSAVCPWKTVTLRNMNCSEIRRAAGSGKSVWTVLLHSGHMTNK